MSHTEFVFRIKKDAIHANTPEEFLRKAKVDVVMAKENHQILRAVSIMDVLEKLGGGNGRSPRPPKP